MWKGGIAIVIVIVRRREEGRGRYRGVKGRRCAMTTRPGQM